MGVLAFFYTQGMSQFQKNVANNSIELDHRLILKQIGESIRSSKAILASANIDGVSYITGTTTLALSVFSIDANGNLIAGEDIIVYDLNTSTQKVIELVNPSANSTRILKKSILANYSTSLEFTYNNLNPTLANSIAVRLSSQRTIGATTETITDSSLFTLR